MVKPTCQKVFTDAKAQRLAAHPFDRVSAYKVRESRANIEHERRVVLSVAAYLNSPKSQRADSTLVGCTSEDKAMRLHAIPSIIARELGYNLHPAVAALSVEGVPPTAVSAFVASIEPRVHQLVKECDAVQAATGRSLRAEYRRMRNGYSRIYGLCEDASSIAEDAVSFCRQHGVL